MITKEELQKLINKKLSIVEISTRLETSTRTVQRYLAKYNLYTFRSNKNKKHKKCKGCGDVNPNNFSPERYIECKKCRLLYQKMLKVNKKKVLVEYKGGKCERCGYSKCLRALQFHHIDPHTKEFEVSRARQSLDELKKEADKCMLLCANCHAEIHDSGH